MAGSDTRVKATARALTELSLSAGAGDYLGAESDLLVRLGVSRPTLRQAAKIVESERLISIRRGLRGGFYAERPDAEDAIRALARYLRLNGTRFDHVFAVTRLVAEEAAAQAARNREAVLRERLAAFRARIDLADTAAGMIRSEAAFGQLLAEMSGNPAIALVMAIGYSFGMAESGLTLFATAEDRRRARDLQRSVADAVLAGDPDVARLMMRRRSAMIEEWAAAQT